MCTNSDVYISYTKTIYDKSRTLILISMSELCLHTNSVTRKLLRNINFNRSREQRVFKTFSQSAQRKCHRTVTHIAFNLGQNITTHMHIFHRHDCMFHKRAKKCSLTYIMTTETTLALFFISRWGYEYSLYLGKGLYGRTDVYDPFVSCFNRMRFQEGFEMHEPHMKSICEEVCKYSCAWLLTSK